MHANRGARAIEFSSRWTKWGFTLGRTCVWWSARVAAGDHSSNRQCRRDGTAPFVGPRTIIGLIGTVSPSQVHTFLRASRSLDEIAPWGPMESPRGAEQRAVVDPHHEPTARRLARHRAICAGPARCEHRRKQANPWGRLLWVTFLGEARKVTGPARPQSALVVPATRIRSTTVTLSLALSPQGRGDQMRSWFDKLTTNGGATPI